MAGAGAFGGAFVVAFAGTFAGAFAGALAGAFAGAFAVAVAVAVAVLLLSRVGEQITTAVMLGLAAIAIAGAVALGAADDGGVQLLLFWALLPFVNMLWDGPSWLASRWLGNDLLNVVRDAERPIRSKAGSVVLHVLVDFFLPGMFLVALAATLPPVVEAFNASTAARMGEAPFPLTATGDGDVGYLCAAVAVLLGGGWWLWNVWEPTLPGWLTTGIEMFRELLLGTALWDFAAASDCLAVGPA